MTNELSPPHMKVRAQLFIELIAFLNQMGITYCLTGNTDRFPQAIESDVDIVVPARDLKHIVKQLAKSGLKRSARMVQIIQHEQTAYYTVLALQEKELLKPVFLHPDFSSHYFQGGRFALSAEEMLDSREIRNQEAGFYQLKPSMNFTYYLIKRIRKAVLEESHGAFLSQLYKMSPDACEKSIQRFWSQPEAIQIQTAAAQNNWQEVQSSIHGLQNTLRRMSRAGPGQRIAETWRRLQRTIYPTGLYIAFLGADGSGKSSVMHQAMNDLAPAFRKTIAYHLRPGLIQYRQSSGSNATAPHSKPSKGIILSLFKLIYFWLDYTLGYWFKIRPQTVFATLVCIDRHFIDFVIDPLRFQYSGASWLTRIATRLIPQPDLFILLDAPSSVLQERKQEVPFEESERQRQAYLQWARSQKNCYIADASQPFENVVSEVESFLLNHLADRTSRRLGIYDG